ncbi:ABC transporter permease [Pseudonocardia acaciae]|uniref:ABC transporter permease n=1 Tax=Pseudonocardia acaciae TaxID=551276 RepID=UPI0004904977|nr:ABC transporter permease [Pseudonocardia acaciae]
MDLSDAFRAALRALRVNKMRSALTTIGIVIGIAAVIIGVALGNGVKAWFDELVGPLMTQITVTSLEGHTTGAVQVKDLSNADVAALRDPARAPDIASVTPVVSGGVILRAGDGERRITVLGSTDDYLTVTDRKLAAGRHLDRDRARAGVTSREIVLGPTPVRELFANDPSAAIGQQVRLDRTAFQVVGVLAMNGQQDNIALMPIQTARTYLFGNNTTVNQIIVKATSAATVPAATEQITSVLDARHHVADPSRRDFELLSLQRLIEQRQQFLDALQGFIAIIAAISLLVGGIGVANIMLVSVTERTREIGLRKAVGASATAVVRQFLIESSTLANAGGVAGVLFGVLTCQVAAIVIPRATDTFPAPVVSPGSIALSFGISVTIGIMAGLYPAMRAANMHIVDALRYE